MKITVFCHSLKVYLCGQSVKSEERLDKTNTEKTELADKLAAIAMQSQHASSRKAAVKPAKHTDSADANFEEVLEDKGQQTLIKGQE